jgi:Sigma-70, region 4/Putative zinc-finger
VRVREPANLSRSTLTRSSGSRSTARLPTKTPFPYSDSLHLDFLAEFSREDIRAVLMRLPEIYRIPLVVVYMEGYLARELAEMLDVPLGTVLARLHRGRKLFETQIVGVRRADRTIEGGCPVISCTEAVRQLWEYLDGTVDDAERDLIDEHLGRCRRCCGELEFARELRQTLAAAAHDDLPADVLHRLNQTLEELEP